MRTMQRRQHSPLAVQLLVLTATFITLSFGGNTRFVISGEEIATSSSSSSSSSENDFHGVIAKNGTNVAATVVSLSNGVQLPAAGLGVGNLAHDRIADMIRYGIESASVRLIDTARASRNEHLVRSAISEATAAAAAATTTASDQSAEKDGTTETIATHVVTKVWYTHLGYRRTILSVGESLRELLSQSPTGGKAADAAAAPEVAVHVLLHWPRCRNDISWMDCQGEEDRLPAAVKEVDPNPPHMFPETAWKDSWRALEDMYLTGQRRRRRGKSRQQEQQQQQQQQQEHDVSDDVLLAESEQYYESLVSIGVSNFDVNDLRELLSSSPPPRVIPHILQTNVWTVLFDPNLVKICRDNGIHLQVYNVMNGIFSPSRKERAPNAFRLLSDIAAELNNSTRTQVVLTWLVHHEGVSVIPRTRSMEHLRENAVFPNQLASEGQADQVRAAVAALLRGRDLRQPKVTFVNKNRKDNDDGRDGNNQKGNVHLFWLDTDSGKELPMRGDLEPGQSYESDTHPGHTFVAYDRTRSTRREYRIEANYGESEQIHIEL